MHFHFLGRSFLLGHFALRLLINIVNKLKESGTKTITHRSLLYHISSLAAPFHFMQIHHGRTLYAIAIAMQVARYKGCSAFGSSASRSCARRGEIDPIRRVISGGRADVRLTSFASPPERQGGDSSSSARDFVVGWDLERALEYARDMDKKHGLCTEPSQSAWKVVDEIYERIRDGGDDASNARQREFESEQHCKTA